MVSNKYIGSTDYNIVEYIKQLERRIESLEAGRTSNFSTGPGIFSPNDGTFTASDGNSNQRFVVSSTTGILFPYFTHTAIPSSEITSPSRSTTSSSFTSLYHITGEQQNPSIKVRLYVLAGAATTGEIRLYENNTAAQIGSTYTVVGGYSGYATITATLPTSYSQENLSVDVQARRLSGSFSIALTVMHVMGRE